MIFGYEELLMGRIKYRYPDWSCTKEVTKNTRPVRRAKWLRPDPVKPQPTYSFHTPFYTKTDGKQWVIQSDSSIGWIRTIGFISSFFFLIFLFFGLVPFPNDGTVFFLSMTGLTFLLVSFSMYQSRTRGEDTWVVFDRTTRNVCFWKKNQEHSLTVPFEQVKCYWNSKYMRGGPVSSFFLMPEVNLSDERNRLWKVHFGFAPQYEQAQFFWRVLTDFMDKSRPIPEVPGLIHQIRFVEKNGYTIEDLTEGGIEITEADFNEVAEEIQNDMAALDARLRRMIKPDQFSADRLIEFYEACPIYAKEDVLRTIVVKLKRWVKFLKGEDRMMDPAYKDFFTLKEYEAEMDKLSDFFFKVDKERREAMR